MHIWSWSKNCVGLCDMCVCVWCQAPKPPDLTQESELRRATYRVVAQRAQNGECDAHQWPYPRSCSVYSLRGGRQIRPAKMSVISAVQAKFPSERGRKTKPKKTKTKLGQGRSPAQVRPTSFPPYARHLHQTSRSGAATCPRSRSRRSCSSRPASPVWARCSTGSIGFSSRARCVCVLARLFFARTPPWSLSRVLGRTPLLRPHEVGRGYGAA